MEHPTTSLANDSEEPKIDCERPKDQQFHMEGNVNKMENGDWKKGSLY